MMYKLIPLYNTKALFIMLYREEILNLSETDRDVLYLIGINNGVFNGDVSAIQIGSGDESHSRNVAFKMNSFNRIFFVVRHIQSVAPNVVFKRREFVGVAQRFSDDISINKRRFVNVGFVVGLSVGRNQEKLWKKLYQAFKHNTK